MINAIIVDDEKDGTEVLQFLIGKHCPNIHIAAVAHRVEDAIPAILQLKPGLVFLDIEMSTGTGFDIIKATESHAFEKIFTTAYEQYAIKAIKTNAADYLLKPIDVDELVQAVKNAEKRIGHSTSIQQALQGQVKKIVVPSQEGFLMVETDDIVRMEADSNYTHIFFKTKRKLVVAKTLKSFEGLLPKTQFCRVHSAHLVNINEIDRYIKGDGGTLVLKDASNIPVSRANKNELLIRLKGNA